MPEHLTPTDTGGGGWYKTGHGYPDWFSVVELFLLCFFALELALGAILADHDRNYWLSRVSCF